MYTAAILLQLLITMGKGQTVNTYHCQCTLARIEYCTITVTQFRVYSQPGMINVPYKLIPSEFDGCRSGTDSRWNITWANTEQNATDTQHCPGGAKTQGNSDL